jgi:hypothetical protein
VLELKLQGLKMERSSLKLAPKEPRKKKKKKKNQGIQGSVEKDEWHNTG